MDLTNKWLYEPNWSWNPSTEQSGYVHDWIQKIGEGKTPPDCILYGAPLSKSSISVSGASLYPEVFRKLWKQFATYNFDEDIDLSSYKVADAGDILMHTTDVAESHRRIEIATNALKQTFPSSTLCMIGGDHSTTACAIRGLKREQPNRTIGILQLDTHLDVRDPAEYGPANGTPIRQLIEQGIVRGEHVVNIGLHGYYNTKSLVEYAKKHHIRTHSLKAARKKGVSALIEQELKWLSSQTDLIYVTVDMDVIDISFAPGVPAATPGGMRTEELFEGLLTIGKYPAVNHIDFVCLDPSRDSRIEETCRIGVHAWLQFMTGRMMCK
ncbi:agmatinase family protein [Pradoshia sp.]